MISNMTPDFPICVHCHKPVEVHRNEYEIFEKMHWLCFHLEFEHDGDPDKMCDDPSCPWWHIQVLRDELEKLGFDPSEIISQAIVERWKL